MTMRTMHAGIFSFLLSLLLVACGGGGSGSSGNGGGGGGGTVPQPPTGLSYAGPKTYAVGIASAPLTPTVSNTATGYSVAPVLPAGLSLDQTTGVISGTPAAVTAQGEYAITARNSAGSTTFALTLTVAPAADAPPSGLSYSSPNVFAVGSAIATLSPTVTGAVSSYSVAPALPVGLTLSATTGQITGTPTSPAAQGTYTITAANAAGSTSFDVVITINATSIVPPSGLSYATPQVFTVGTGITPLLPTVTGPVSSYAVTPALPAGLVLLSDSGNISGTPTTVTAQTVYTITASNEAGSTAFALTITVNPAAPPTLSLIPFTRAVNAGRDATISWRTTGTTACTASGGWSGARAANGDERVPVNAASVTYRMTCEGPGGTVSDTVSVRRRGLCSKPAVAFDAPTTVNIGAAATLRWFTADAAACVASGGWSGTKSLMGTETTGALTTDTTFVLTCDGDVGQTVYARGVGINRSPPTLYMQSDFKEVDVSGDVHLNYLVWSATAATSCTATGAWSGAQAASGFTAVPRPSQATTYGLQCTGLGGTTAASLVISPVTNNAPPVGTADLIPVVEGQRYSQISLQELWFANDSDPDGCPAAFLYQSKNDDGWAQWDIAYETDEPVWFKASADVSGDLEEVYYLVDNRARRAATGTTAIFRVAPANDTPQLVPDVGATRMNSGPVWIQITRNDSGLDEPLSLSVSRNPAHGSVLIGKSVTGVSDYPVSWFARYIPTTGFSGTDSFDYRVVDAQGDVATTTVTMDVLAADCAADGTYTAPLPGSAGTDWRAIQFADANAATGSVADSRGGPYAHDQQPRTRFLIGDLDDIYAEIPVRAMQCGRVIEVVENYFDASPADRAEHISGICANTVVVQRSDGTKDRYCNLRLSSVAVAVGDDVSEGQYLGRAGASGGYPGLGISVTAPDGSNVDLLSVAGGFDVGYPTSAAVLGFGVAASSDPRASVDAARLRPELQSTLSTEDAPVLWYRVYGVPSTAPRTLSIEDGNGVIVWTSSITPASPVGVFAYAAGSSNDLAAVERPARLPNGSYVARLSITGSPATTASYSFNVQ